MINQPHLLTFDIEHWFEGYRHRGFQGWEQLPPRDPATIERLLGLLERYSVHATFFVTGQFAKEFPNSVATIAASGHEIASHSYDHIPLTRMDGPSFREALRRALGLLQDASGRPVLGFRAPFWSMPRSIRSWALEALAEAGMLYDSSVFPRGLETGKHDDQLSPHRLHLASGASLWEFPASVLVVARTRIPAAGGFFLRFLPAAVTRATLHQAAGAGRPGLVYLHPYDMDPGCPRLPASPHFTLMRYHRLDKTERVLEQLLREFQFGTIRDWLNANALATTS